MTPEEARALFVPKVTDNYLAEEDKVTVVAAFLALDQVGRDEIQRAFEAGNARSGGNLIQKARRSLADALALVRVDEIIVDENINMITEIDELL